MNKLFELVLKNGFVVLPDGVAKVDIGVIKGKVSAIVNPGLIDGQNVIDATNKVIIPGVVDMHVHFRDPGQTHKEDFFHGSSAAACGGVTTVMDMPNTIPEVCTASAFVNKVNKINGSSFVDYGFWAGGTDINEIQRMFDLGAIGLKVFMIKSSGKNSPYSNKLSMPNDATFLNILQTISHLKMPISIHLNNPSILDNYKENLENSGQKDAFAFCESLRGIDSIEAARRVLLFAEETGAKVHIAHISHGSSKNLKELKDARARGIEVTTETPPPALSINELKKLGPFGIPFAFSETEANKYWRGLAEGTIDVIATDHAPHTREEKELGINNIWKAPPGYPGVETSLSLVFDAVLRDVLSIERMVKVMSENPAKILGLNNKGKIAIGYDADFVVLNKHGKTHIDETKLHSKSGWSPYNGRKLNGQHELTILRGEIIAKNGDLVSKIPQGKMIK